MRLLVFLQSGSTMGGKLLSRNLCFELMNFPLLLGLCVCIYMSKNLAHHISFVSWVLTNSDFTQIKKVICYSFLVFLFFLFLRNKKERKAWSTKLADRKRPRKKERREKDISEGNDKKADDQRGREPEYVIKRGQEKWKPETGNTVHDGNACISSSASSSDPCAVNDDSDSEGESLLPENPKDVISRSDSESIKLLNSLSMNDLYYFPSQENPIFIENGTKRISKDEGSGKICCMIGAKGLTIEHSEASECWQWKSLPETSRFSQVAEIKEVWFLHIKGQIRTDMLSSKTTYGVYFVYKFAESIPEFHQEPVELWVEFKGQQQGKGPGNYLDPSQPCQDGRGEEWREIEMGEFFIEQGEDAKVVCILMQTDNGVKKAGLIVGGIEFRPKD